MNETSIFIKITVGMCSGKGYGEKKSLVLNEIQLIEFLNGKRDKTMEANTYMLIRREIQSLGAHDPLLNVLLLLKYK